MNFFERIGRKQRPFRWGCQSMILIDYLQKERTITGQYYSDMLTIRCSIVGQTPSFTAQKCAASSCDICSLITHLFQNAITYQTTKSFIIRLSSVMRRKPTCLTLKSTSTDLSTSFALLETNIRNKRNKTIQRV